MRDMVNSNVSRCKQCMVLLRLLVLEGMKQNVRIFCRHVRTKDNGTADALSRGQMKRFRRLAPANVDLKPTTVPECLWPMERVWLKQF